MEKKDLRIIFMGTPEFAVETLRALVENQYNVVAVVTQPDKPVGRHHDQLQPPAVKRYAQLHNLPVLQPEKMKDSGFVEQLKSYQAHLQVVVAFRMLPEVVWSMPTFGTFNVHAALLPRYRGAAPIQWAIINGETQTGVTTFFLDHDIDTGRIILQRSIPLLDDADGEQVYNSLMYLGATAAIETIEIILAGNGIIVSTPQDQILVSLSGHGEKLPVAPKIFKETCRINWRQPSKRIYDFVRALSPQPGAWTEFRQAPDGKSPVIVKIYRSSKTDRLAEGEPGTFVVVKSRLYVNTTDFQLEILELQQSGKRRLPAADFLNGLRKNVTFWLE